MAVMFIKQIEKPDIKKLLESLPPPPQLPCNQCGYLMSSKPRLFYCNYDAIKAGWEIKFIADTYSCEKIFHLFGSNPVGYFATYEGDKWEWTYHPSYP